MHYRQTIGKKGEDAVAKWLQQRGFRIVARNIHTRYGEIDIIASRNNVIHMIEVKTRTSDTFGGPETALTRQKFIKMKKCVQQLRIDYPILYKKRIQLDFISVFIPHAQSLEIQFFWNLGEEQFY